MPLVKPYLKLCRLWLSLFAAGSAATGYFLAPGLKTWGALFAAAAVFLLACGASALNQYQERTIDAKMERTRQRPLPSGTLSPVRALFFSFTLIAAGMLLLVTAFGREAAALGAAAIVWYNGFYTPLKKVSAFAAVPGAAVGMLPPAIGWAAAGGPLLDPRLFAVCALFFLWQVPHFWLLVLRHGSEYEKAGLPSLTGVMGRAQIARVTFAWIVAAAVASFALPLYGSVRTSPVYVCFFPLAFWLIWSERSLAGRTPPLSPSPALFRTINVYLFLMMALLSAEGILSHLP